MRRGPWKLVSAGPDPGPGFDFPPGTLGSGETGLFNIVEDPSEKKNLIKEKSDIAESLQKEFAAWNATLVDPKWVTLHQPLNNN